MVVEQRAGDAGSELDAVGARRHRAQPGPDEARGAGVVHPRMEMVGAEHRVESRLLGRHRLLDQLFRLVGLVTAQPGKFHEITEPVRPRVGLLNLTTPASRSPPRPGRAVPRSAETRLTVLPRAAEAVAMTSRISHTSFDAINAYAQSVFWSQVHDFVEDPDDPNEPEHEECLITSRDRSQLLLFITVPESKQVKNRVHLDLRPVDRTREQEVERILALGASQLADHRRPDGSEFCVLPTEPAGSGATT